MLGIGNVTILIWEAEAGLRGPSSRTSSQSSCPRAALFIRRVVVASHSPPRGRVESSLVMPIMRCEILLTMQKEQLLNIIIIITASRPVHHHHHHL